MSMDPRDGEGQDGSGSDATATGATSPLSPQAHFASLPPDVLRCIMHWFEFRRFTVTETRSRAGGVLDLLCVCKAWRDALLRSVWLPWANRGWGMLHASRKG